MSKKLSGLTAVVCTLNSESSLTHCLSSLKEFLDEIIVVDGGSTDKTLEIASRFKVQILHDSGSGLGEARGLGLSKVKSEYVLNCGADNVINVKVVRKMIERLKAEPNIYGVSCQTVVEEDVYIGKASNRIWRTKFNSGYASMVGTPNIFRTQQLRKFGYIQSRGWSDDEEICTRMREEDGALFEILSDQCIEVGQASLKRQIYRFFHYGYSDYEIYSARKQAWSFRRKAKSILHPLRVEFLVPMRELEVTDKVYCFPLLVLATLLRYAGWIFRLSK